MNQYFYQLILDAVSWNKLPYVPNFKIYEHDLNWHSKNIFREGYLFLGLPEDRSTAQPERDFYIHIMPPFTSADAPAKILDDEVYFHFKPDDNSKKNLALYAAARKLEQISDGKDRTAYKDKADNLHKNFVRTLGTTSFDVVYKGTRQRLVDILRGYSLLTETFGDTLDLAAALCLEDYFCKKYPDFPAMKIKVTRQNLINLTREAYDYFAGKTTNAAAAMLRSFEILDGNEIRPEHSHFAKYFIGLVNALPPQGVLNYSDLFEDSGVRKIDRHFKIPFDLTPIIFLAMVYGGFAEITFGNGSKLTAGNLEQRLNSQSIVSDLIEFKYLSRASEMPLAALKKFFTIINLNPAQLTDPNQINIAVKNLLDKAQKLRNAAVSADGILSRNFELMGESLVTNQWLQKMKDACNKIRREFDNYHARFDTPAKLHNFNLNDAQLDELAENLRIMNFVREYANFRTGCLEAVTYLANVEFTEHLKNELEETKRFFRIKRQSILSNLKGDLAAQQVCQEIAKFKKLYSHFYFSRHAKNRLNADDAKRKGAILESQTFANLRNLSRIGIFSTAHFKELEQQLAAMKICYELSTAELDKQTTCPHCHYRLSDPDFDAREQLDRLEALPDKILREWEKILLDTLSDPLVQPNMQFLNEQQRLAIQHFLSDRKLPPRVEDFFIVSVKALLKNYQQVVINANDFIRRLEALPPLDERNFRRKIDEFISQLTAGKDPSTVRISIKRK